MVSTTSFPTTVRASIGHSMPVKTQRTNGYTPSLAHAITSGDSFSPTFAGKEIKESSRVDDKTSTSRKSSEQNPDTETEEPKEPETQTLPMSSYIKYVLNNLKQYSNPSMGDPVWIPDEKGRKHHPKRTSIIPDNEENLERAILTLKGENPDSRGTSRPGTPKTPYNSHGFKGYWDGEKYVQAGPR